ncbi:energy transducer TonB [Phaeobacter sp. HF9A]|uniref:energy transducer TonB n=1 Tax=Phaeobacter sp. HF9A TaxID=2721561 RepID=UPI0014314CD5|nr:energy transducer TonB [Phaeobacter sp. HF9A]
MQTGTKISVAAHGLLITWALFGGWFHSEPLPIQSQDVSIISAEDFARLSAQQAAPVVAPEPSAPQTPELSETTPDIPARPDPVVETQPEPPEPVAAPVEDPQPEPPAPEPTPEVPTITPDAPEVPEILSDLPQTAEPETAQANDRVAPEPIQAPEPDTQVDEVVQEEVTPDEGAEANQPVQEATAPEAASDRIVTEAEADEAEPTAPLATVRPRSRPSRPTPVEEPEETVVAEETPPEPTQPDPAQEVDESAVNDALAEALAGAGEVEAPEPSGQPMTRGEKDALRVAVSQCWNVGSLSSEALRTTVVVGVSLSREGVPDIGSLRMKSSSGGSASSAKQAYEAARRAIIRCGSKGFDLPADKYAQWRDIEMTFNPEGMRIR